MYFSVCSWIQYCDCYLMSPVGSSPHFSQYECGCSVYLISSGQLSQSVLSRCLFLCLLTLCLDCCPSPRGHEHWLLIVLWPWPMTDSRWNQLCDAAHAPDLPPRLPPLSAPPLSSCPTPCPCRSLAQNLQRHLKVSGWSYPHYFLCVGEKAF